MINRFPRVPTDAVTFVLADGTKWVISGKDKCASLLVSQLGEVMQLQPISGSSTQFSSDSSARLVPRFLAMPAGGLKNNKTGPPHSNSTYYLIVTVNGHNSPTDIDATIIDGAHKLASSEPANPASSILPQLFPDTSAPDSMFICDINPAATRGEFLTELRCLSQYISLVAQAKGGILLHGALVEWKGSGVILAGPGGAGKSTASQRLPPPWHSLSDDASLVVRDSEDKYWAHPWPTWSRFFFGGPGGSWDLQQAVPLKGIFFLEQMTVDQMDVLSAEQAALNLVASVEQVSRPLTTRVETEQARATRLEWLDNACMLAQTIPAFRLQISLTGTFWKEIERSLV